MFFDLSGVNFAAVLVTGIVTIVGAFFGSYLMWKLIGPGVVNAGVGESLGPAMLNWLFDPSIKTGEKIVEKREKADGTTVDKEVDEVLAPAEVLALRMGKVVYALIFSKLGVDARKKGVLVGDIQAELANPDSPFSQFAGFLSPKARERALKDGDYVPILLDLIVSSPQARDLVGKAINKFKGQSITQSAVSGPSGVGGKTW